MTDEQGETLYRLKMSIDTPLNGGSTIIVDKEDIETVLNMLKENSEEIEQKNTELAEKSAEIEKKDKIIDLMAERLRFDEELKFEVCRDCEPLKEELCGEPTKTQYQPTELKCVKQYFERKVKK